MVLGTSIWANHNKTRTTGYSDCVFYGVFYNLWLVYNSVSIEAIVVWAN